MYASRATHLDDPCLKWNVLGMLGGKAKAKPYWYWPGKIVPPGPSGTCTKSLGGISLKGTPWAGLAGLALGTPP